VASIRAGLAAKRYGGSEAIKHLERAVDLWARVPDPARLGGVAKADLFRLLAEMAVVHHDSDRADRYMGAALDLVDEGSDPLLASRVYIAYAGWPVELPDRLSPRDALDRSVAYAGDTPSAELAGAFLALGRWDAERDLLEAAVGFAQRSIEVAAAAGCAEIESSARAEGGMWLVLLGRSPEGIAWLRSGVDVAESAGLLDQALWSQSRLAYNLMLVGEPEAGRALAESGRLRALQAGFPVVAAYNGEQAVEAMLNTGAFADAEVLLEQLHEAGMPEERWRWLRVKQHLAQGDLEAAVPLERTSMEWLSRHAGGNESDHVARQVELFSAVGDIATALQVAQRGLEAMPGGDSRLAHAQVTRAAFVALAAARIHGDGPPEGMRERAAVSLEQVLGWMTDEWSQTCTPPRRSRLRHCPSRSPVTPRLPSGALPRRRLSGTVPTSRCRPGWAWPRRCSRQVNAPLARCCSSKPGKRRARWVPTRSRSGSPKSPGAVGLPSPVTTGCRTAYLR
jgi:hypothetical protein